MKLLSFLRKTKEIKEPRNLTIEQRRLREQAILKHKRRIENLTVEVGQLSDRLEEIENNFDLPVILKDKEIDTTIRRMTLIRYEIDVREGLVKWLS